jgi:tRNA threonylcarbamoyladenosine biosynthesis protein TsaB
LLALDTGSPVVSVALGHGGRILAQRSLEQARSSGALLRLVDEALAEAGVELAELEGLVGLRGPGSFTGLRVGLATLRGLHEALRVPATAIPTFDALAALSPADGTLTATAVDALRGEWFVQMYRAAAPMRQLGPPRCVAVEDLVALRPQRLIGFGVSGLAGAFDVDAAPATLEPDALAGAALRAVQGQPMDWNPDLLTDPLYLRPPAVTPPGTPARG